MRRTIGFVTLWFLAGAAASTVAWLGVATVSDQLAASGSHPDPLSAEEIQRAVEASSTTTVVAGAPSTSTTSTTAAPPSTTSTTAGSTAEPPAATTTTAPAPPTTRAYDLVGGSATLRFSATGVTVVVATPRPGFTVDIGDSHDGGARVEFESDEHRSRLDAWWMDGPQDEVREEDR